MAIPPLNEWDYIELCCMMLVNGRREQELPLWYMYIRDWPPDEFLLNGRVD